MYKTAATLIGVMLIAMGIALGLGYEWGRTLSAQTPVGEISGPFTTNTVTHCIVTVRASLEDNEANIHNRVLTLHNAEGESLFTAKVVKDAYNDYFGDAFSRTYTHQDIADDDHHSDLSWMPGDDDGYYWMLGSDKLAYNGESYSRMLYWLDNCAAYSGAVAYPPTPTPAPTATPTVTATPMATSTPVVVSDEATLRELLTQLIALLQRMLAAQ